MLIGRTAELDRLDAVLADAVGGHRSVLRVVGEAGVGTTALLDAAVRRARRRGLPVVRVRAVPLDPPPRLAVVDDLLRVLDVGATRPRDVADAASAVVEALAGACARGPTLLVLDDLDDADVDSRTAVAAAVDRLTEVPLAVLTCCRPGSPEGPVASWPRCDVEPLTEESALALLRSILGPEASDAVVASLATGLGGNAAALCETARVLTAEQVRGSAPLPDPLPVGTRLAARVASSLCSLSVGGRRSVEALAVLGDDHRDLLADVLDAEGCTTDDLRDAEATGLVLAAGGPRLPSRLVELAVLSLASPADLRRLHREAARSAASRDRAARVVIAHLVAGNDLPDEEAAAALQLQARRALADGAVSDAAFAMVASARLTPEEGLRRRRAISAVHAWIEAGLGSDGATELLDLVGPGPYEPDDAGWVAWLRASTQPDLRAQLVATWQAADEATDASTDVRRFMLWEAAMAAWALGDAEAGWRAVEALTTTTERHDDREVAWMPDALRSAGLFQLGSVQEATVLRRRVLASADSLDPTDCEVVTLLDAVFLDDLLLADTPGSEARLLAALARTSGDSGVTEPCLLGIRAWRLRAQGAWGLARRTVDEGLDCSARLGASITASGQLALSVELASLQGHARRLQEDGQALSRLGELLSDRRRLTVLDRALGMAALVDGDLDAAAVHLESAADVDFLGRGLRDAVLSSRVDLVEVLVRLGDRGVACDRRDGVREHLTAMDEPLAAAWWWRASALTATPDDADGLFARSLTAHARAADRFEHARTELLLGEHLRRTRRRADARRHLARAEAVFARLDARPWLERARQELRVAGGRSTSTVDLRALTPQERNVAEAVAEGRSTREVADLLVLSPRTVESHLSSAYRKLGVHGRTGLVALMRGG